MKEQLDKDYIKKVLELLGHREAGGVTEVRIFPPDRYMIINGRREYVGATVSGYYDDYAKLVDDIAPFDGKTNIYTTINPVIPDLLARAYNRLRYSVETTTSNDDILCDLWFPIDCDPIRPEGISATEAELQAAIIKRDETTEFLSPWAQSLLGMSGNGGHGLIRLPGYPNNKSIRDKKERLTKYLHDRFTDWELDDLGNFVLDEKGRKILHEKGVSVDNTVFNISRIWKLYGTLAVKGENIQSRPHRRAYLDIPDAIPDPVDLYAKLDEIIPQESTQEQEPSKAQKPSSNSRPKETSRDGDYPLLEVKAYLNASLVRWRTKEKGDITWYQFETCPLHTDDDSDRWECGICQDSTGKMGAKCMHEPSYTWQDFKEVLGDPKPYYVKEAKKGKKERVGSSPGENINIDEMETEPVPDDETPNSAETDPHQKQAPKKPKDNKVRDDKRSHHLLFLAKRYHHQKMPRKEMLALLVKTNESHCEPSLSEVEVNAILDKVSPRLQSITAAELLEMDIPEPKWAIPEFIPEGLTILAGRPKVGKSWLALSLCAAVAMGGYAFGKIPVEPGETLFIGLEDNYRRLQDRLSQLCENEQPSKLHLLLDLPKLDQGGLDVLGDWLDEHEGIRLVVIDTLAKVRPQSNRRNDLYSEDYNFTGTLQRFALNRSIALVIVHHTRKMEAEYAIDELSGTTGISAGADCILMLKRTLDGNVLFRTGRDVEEGEFAVRRDKDVGGWELLGDAKEFAISEQRQAIIEFLREANDTMSPKDIAEALGKEGGSVRRLLSSMVRDGVLTRPSRGKYQVSDISGNNGNNGNNRTTVTTVTTELLPNVISDENSGNNREASNDVASETIVTVVTDVTALGNKQCTTDNDDKKSPDVTLDDGNIGNEKEEIVGHLSTKLAEYLKECPRAWAERLMRSVNAGDVPLSRAIEAARRRSIKDYPGAQRMLQN